MKFRRILFCLLMIAIGGALLGCDRETGGGEHQHQAAVWKTVTAPTCTEEGVASGTCVECGEAMSITLDKIPHAYTETVTPPTCDTAGYTTYTCSCGYTYDGAQVPPKGHKIIKTSAPPTCTKEGYTLYSCACGYSYSANRVVPKGHAMVPTVTPPTCDAEGYTTYTCACGYSYVSDYTAAEGHDLTATETPPTCETEGYTTYTCACGYSYVSDYTAAEGHKFEGVITLPTCVEAGYTRFSCACGATYDGDFQLPTGHTLIEEVVAPTCDKAGYTRCACACGYAYDKDPVSPMGHVLVETVLIPPTCEEAGLTHYECERCAYTGEGHPVAPLAHARTRISFYHPTLNRDGYVQHTCLDCGYDYRETILYADIAAGAYVENTVVLKQGIDTSNWNHSGGAELDWEALKAAGVDFVILKAGSSNGIDPFFERDYLAAKAAGLEVGAYFFAYSTTVEETLADADMLLTWLEGKQFELPIYFDVEDSPDVTFSTLGQDILMDLCKTFILRLQEAGYYAALYTNTEWLYNLLDTEWIKTNLDVWYARYTVTPPETGFTPEDTDFPWKDGTASLPGETDKRFGLWQYTDSGRIEGFPENFDFNYCFKEYKSIMIQWGLNGF